MKKACNNVLFNQDKHGTVSPNYYYTYLNYPMIKIGKMTDYAMLIMSQMAKEPDAVLSATSLADVLYLNAPTVSKILKILSDAGLVSSIRGADGGYRLARPAADIKVVNVITAMEGDLALTECCESAGLCAIDSMCVMRDNWRKINNMIHTLLGQYSILDMLTPLAVKGSLEVVE